MTTMRKFQRYGVRGLCNECFGYLHSTVLLLSGIGMTAKQLLAPIVRLVSRPCRWLGAAIYRQHHFWYALTYNMYVSMWQGLALATMLLVSHYVYTDATDDDEDGEEDDDEDNDEEEGDGDEDDDEEEDDDEDNDEDIEDDNA